MLGAELARSHKAEMDALRTDVAEKIPKITAAAVERLEGQYAHRLEAESAAIRSRFDVQVCHFHVNFSMPVNGRLYRNDKS